ncbi:caspase-1-like isoform X1 [Brevipalpus obovatus]|uniref:caspase-1-like isoform X1 n=1 Tax=Brevipalpus obovatus TaxID=246614 RepID=UPI003D9E1C43
MECSTKKVKILRSIEEIDAKLHQIWNSPTSYRKPKYPRNSDIPIYPMTHTPKGTCLIFNHRIFDCQELEERANTGLDAHALSVAFGYLGFQVRRYDDMKKQQIMETLKSTADEDHSSRDAFFCIFLTYGQETSIWAKDEKFPANDVFNMYVEDQCPSLRDKPKIFLLQTCRRIGKRPFNVMGRSTHGRDFLIAFTNAPVCHSELKNSLYMQSFSQALLRFGRYFEIEDIIMKAITMIRFYFKAENMFDGGNSVGENYPSQVFQLYEYLYFFPENVQEVGS